LTLDATQHALEPERLAYALRHLRTPPVIAVEWQGEILVELGAIVEHALADGVEGRERRAVAPELVGDLAPAGRVADQHDVAQVELCDQFGQVVGVLVHVVAIPGLVGSSVATAVVRDHPVALLTQEQHLAIPGVGAERPAVAKQHRSTDLLGGQHVVLRGWVLGSGQWSARTKPKRGPVRPEPDGLGRPSSLRAVP
jgi:hypothetical protein